MFDVGFWELLFIFTLGLLVLGPEKLPGIVTTAGRWMGRARSLARGLRLQIEREMAAEQTVRPPPARPASASKPSASSPHTPENPTVGSPSRQADTAGQAGEAPQAGPEKTGSARADDG